MLQYCFYFFFFWPWGMWDLTSLTRDQTDMPCIGRLRLDPWAAREVPVCKCLSSFILELKCLTCFLETGLPWVSITICLYLQTKLQHLTQCFIIYFLFSLNFQLYQLIICLQVSGHWSADVLASFDYSSLLWFSPLWTERQVCLHNIRFGYWWWDSTLWEEVSQGRLSEFIGTCMSWSSDEGIIFP